MKGAGRGGAIVTMPPPHFLLSSPPLPFSCQFDRRVLFCGALHCSSHRHLVSPTPPPHVLLTFLPHSYCCQYDRRVLSCGALHCSWSPALMAEDGFGR